MLTDEEKFRFDLEGYLIIPGVLSAEECTTLSAQCDEHWPRQAADGASVSYTHLRAHET